MNSPAEAILYALEKYPERVGLVPLEDLVVESARGNDKRPAYLKLAVSDEIVKSLRGSADRRTDLLLLVSIPKEVMERSESSIILPNEI
jgi:hypothetical protein